MAVAQAPTGATNVELILDASGSMFNKLEDGRFRIVAAKEVLADLIASLPDDENLNVGLRVYGTSMRAIEPGACEDTLLKVPVASFDRELLLDTVRSTQALGATPIALSLEQAAHDFPADGRKLIVLITDGAESCRGDLREVAESLVDIEVDLRIIGFDLDEAALRSFEGLGALENARSAAELLAALTRAVEVTQPAAPETHVVTVTLTREGEPAEDGPVVEFVGAVDEVEHSFAPAGSGGAPGTFTAELPAGSFTARVSDAFSEQPLTVGGLVVVAGGANEFAFELAPAASVSLSVDAEHVAGSTATVSFEGAPAGSAWLAVAPEGAGDDTWLGYVNVEGPAGEAEVTVPDAAGAYELRYHVDRPSGGSEVLGRTTITAVAAKAALEAPEAVPAGGRFEVSWDGPDNRDDYVTIVPVGTAEGEWGAYAYTSNGNPLELKAPDQPGDYELRYLTGATNSTLARRAIEVSATEASVRAPDEVLAGSRFSVEWSGPDNTNDYITVVPVGTPEGEWGNYTEVRVGNPLELQAPDDAGEYELWYATGDDGLTLASSPITVTPASASLQIPDQVLAGELFPVIWEGPAHLNDYITIVPVDAAEGEWNEYVYPVENPALLRAPAEPGSYEVRYATGQSGKTLARVPVTVR